MRRMGTLGFGELLGRLNMVDIGDFGMDQEGFDERVQAA